MSTSSGLLARLAADLDDAGVEWAVRDEEPDAVTLLVAPGCAKPVAEALDRCGFARPRKGDGYLAFDTADHWLRLDVATEPRFGPGAAASVAGAAGCRQRRLRGDGPWRRAPSVVARLVTIRRRGLTVALLGPDGVGKSTVAAGTVAAYPLPARLVYMGMWQGADRPGRTRLGAVVAILARPLKARWRAAVAAGHVARGRLVVFDRYTYDALLPVTGPLAGLKRPYFWVLARGPPPRPGPRARSAR